MSVNTFAADLMGQRISELRRKRGFTQTEIAEKLHMKRETLSTIENGLRTLRDYEITQLAEALGTSCDYLLTGIETRNLDIHKAIHLSNEAIERLISFSEQRIEDDIQNWSLPGASDDDPSSTVLTGLNFLLTTEPGVRLLLLLSQYMLIDFGTGRLKLPEGYILFQYDKVVDGEQPGTKQYKDVTFSNEATVTVKQLSFSSILSGKNITLSTETFDEAMLQEILKAIRAAKVVMRGATRIDGGIDIREGEQHE